MSRDLLDLHLDEPTQTALSRAIVAVQDSQPAALAAKFRESSPSVQIFQRIGRGSAPLSTKGKA